MTAAMKFEKSTGEPIDTVASSAQSRSRTSPHSEAGT